ncbi:hypothetical protein WAX87_11095 [Photobacterium damselae subsp. damselae]|uniref:hypothetical protein n=1 Tax=Photobacterium damselae TaxID=38293 RepID=UPI00311B1FAD
MKKFLDDLKSTSKEIKRLPEKLGPFGLQCVRDNYKHGQFKPNAPLTKQTKNQGAHPLFDTGETYASLTYSADEKGYRVGTNKEHAALINDGGTVKAKQAQQLIIPINKQVKRKVEAYGVKKTISMLEKNGWRIIWRPHSVVGRAPPGAKGFGQRIKTRRNRNSKKQDRGVFYTIFIRTPQVKVPSRQFMYLSDEQQKEQRDMAEQLLKEVIK